MFKSKNRKRKGTQDAEKGSSIIKEKHLRAQQKILLFIFSHPVICEVIKTVKRSII